MVDLPEWLDAEDWADLLEYREEIKQPMSAVAQRRMLRRLQRFRECGINVSEAIDQTINSRGWTNVYEPKPNYSPKRPPWHSINCAAAANVVEISEEKRQANIERLHEAMSGVFKIQGAGR